MKRKLSQFLDVPHNVHADWLLSDHKVKGAMKTGTTGRKIGPTKVMNGFHEDGQALQLRMTVGGRGGHAGRAATCVAALWLTIRYQTGRITCRAIRTISGEVSPRRT